MEEKEKEWGKEKNFPRWARPWDAVHSHGRVSLNIIWRWPRFPIVDSLRPSSPFLALFLFDIPWIQRPCDYASPFRPPSFPIVRVRPCRPSKPARARARTRASREMHLRSSHIFQQLRPNPPAVFLARGDCHRPTILVGKIDQVIVTPRYRKVYSFALTRVYNDCLNKHLPRYNSLRAFIQFTFHLNRVTRNNNLFFAFSFD